MKYPPELEQAIPGLREARQDEQSNRALAFSGLTHTILGIEVCPLTPYHRLGLQLVGNAYAVRRAQDASFADSFQFLWFTSAAYSRRNSVSWWKTRRAKAAIVRLVSTHDPELLRFIIAKYIAHQMQDTPEGESAADAPDYSDSIHWMAWEAGFWMNVHGGFTFESYVRTPYLILQQLHRVYRANHPRTAHNPDGSWTPEYPTFINASDRVVGLFHRMKADRIADELLKNTTRIP
jgi:hypothetical protein